MAGVLRSLEERLAQHDGSRMEVQRALLAALAAQENGLVGSILQRAGIQLPLLNARLQEQLDALPKVNTPTEQGKIYITPELNRALLKADDLARQMRDQYVSVEHLLLGLMEEGQETLIK